MKRSKKSNSKLTFWEVPSNVQCAEIFMKSLPKLKDGANDYRSEFLQLGLMLLNNNASFCVQDCIVLAKYKDLPTPEITKLFELWTEKLVELGRLEKVIGAYDVPVYKVV